MEFTSTTKIFSRNFAGTSGLFTLSNRLFHTCGNLVCCCTSTLQQASPPNWAVVFVIVIMNCCSQSVQKSLDSEKEETMKNCSLAWPDHSSLRVISLSAYTESNNALRGRNLEVWLVSGSQTLFSCGSRAQGD